MAHPGISLAPIHAIMLRKRFNLLFYLTVAMPSALALIYYGLIASNVYLSESRFVVRGPLRLAQAGPTALRQGAAVGRAQDDTYSVHEFLISRDALSALEQQIAIRAMYANKNADFINRFPGIDRNDSFEGFFRYYKDRTTIDYDSVSSITTLKVRAFAAEDARRINDQLLNITEKRFSEFNDRAHRELIKIAEQGVAVARERAATIETDLASSRDKVPPPTTSPPSEQHDRLMLDKLFVEKQLAAALSALESARGDALRTPFYLERVVLPNLPDYAVEPRRIRSILLTLVLGLIAWGVLSLLVASVKEHLG